MAEANLSRLETGPAATWEEELGAITAAEVLLVSVPPSDAADARLAAAMAPRLGHIEPRVRLAAGRCLAAAAGRRPTQVPPRVVPHLLDLVAASLDRDAEAEEPSASLPSGSATAAAALAAAGAQRDDRDDEGDARVPAAHTDGTPNLMGELLGAAYATVRPGAGELRHCSEGWKTLESSWRALHAVAEAVGPAAWAPLVDDRMRCLLDRALVHPNRFVRETAHRSLGVVSEADALAWDAGDVAEEDALARARRTAEQAREREREREGETSNGNRAGGCRWSHADQILSPPHTATLTPLILLPPPRSRTA